VDVGYGEEVLSYLAESKSARRVGTWGARLTGPWGADDETLALSPLSSWLETGSEAGAGAGAGLSGRPRGDES